MAVESTAATQSSKSSSVGETSVPAVSSSNGQGAAGEAATDVDVAGLSGSEISIQVFAVQGYESHNNS